MLLQSATEKIKSMPLFWTIWLLALIFSMIRYLGFPLLGSLTFFILWIISIFIIFFIVLTANKLTTKITISVIIVVTLFLLTLIRSYISMDMESREFFPSLSSPSLSLELIINLIYIFTPIFLVTAGHYYLKQTFRVLTILASILIIVVYILGLLVMMTLWGSVDGDNLSTIDKTIETLRQMIFPI